MSTTKNPRILGNVLNEMISIIPENEEDFRIELGLILNKIRYLAPEVCKPWWHLTSKILNKFLPDRLYKQSDWQFKLWRLWSSEESPESTEEEMREIFALWWHTVYRPAALKGYLDGNSPSGDDMRQASWWLMGAFEGRLQRRPTECERNIFDRFLLMTTRNRSLLEILEVKNEI